MNAGAGGACAAALALVIAGCGGTTRTTSSTTSTVHITRTSTSSPVVATSVRVYEPDVKVTARASGRCSAQSTLVARPNVWRCAVGSQDRDPCFRRGTRTVVCPLGGPWGRSALMISVAHPLPRVTARRPGGPAPLPWALELGDGSRCVLLFAGGGGRVTYACDTEVELFGTPDRGRRVWTIFGGSGTVSRRAIRVAWF